MPNRPAEAFDPGLLERLRANAAAAVTAAELFLLAVGGLAVALSVLFPVVPPAIGFVEFVINYTAILCFVVGLALIWVAKVRAGRDTRDRMERPAARR